MTALSGGVFGLLGGWLIDRFGRKSVMVGSIFVYSLSPVCAAFSTQLGWLIFFRCATFVGVCVEFVAAVTWLSELFPDKRQRELAVGWTQAFASVGGLFVTGVSATIGSLVQRGLRPWRRHPASLPGFYSDDRSTPIPIACVIPLCRNPRPG